MKIYLVTLIKPVNTMGGFEIEWEPIRDLVEAPTAIIAKNIVLERYPGNRCEFKDIKVVEELKPTSQQSLDEGKTK